MTQNTLNDEIERIVEPLCEFFDWDFDSEQANEVRKAIREGAKKSIEAVRMEKSNNIGNTINESEGTFEPSIEEIAFEDGFNQAVTEQSKKAKEWLGE